SDPSATVVVFVTSTEHAAIVLISSKHRSHAKLVTAPTLPTVLDTSHCKTGSSAVLETNWDSQVIGRVRSSSQSATVGSLSVAAKGLVKGVAGVDCRACWDGGR